MQNNPAGIHLFRCKWNDTWYKARQECIFALDANHAQDIVMERFNFDNNVQDLNIAEIPIVPVTRIERHEFIQVKDTVEQRNKTITRGSYSRPITRLYCSNCNNQVMPGGDFCDSCGGYFTKGSAY